jgi:microcystin-dependent protein
VNLDRRGFFKLAGAAVAAVAVAKAGVVADIVAPSPDMIADPGGGWLVCDGRTLSRKAYADLFAAMQYNYGGDRINTSKLPDPTGTFEREFKKTSEAAAASRCATLLHD